MIATMSAREKTLATIVGAAVFLLVTFFLADYFLKNKARLQGEVVSKRRQLKSMQTLSADKALWQQRDEWVREKQMKLANPDSGGVLLLDHVKQLAKKHAVLLDNPAIRLPNRRPEYTSISVEVETKSPWRSLIAFLGELQTPEQFIVLESANLKIDGADATQMRGRFKIARWYAPD